MAKHTGRHGNNCAELLIFNQFFSQGFVSSTATKQNTIRNDGRAPSANLQHLDEQSTEEKLRLAGLTQGEQIFADFLLEYTSCEWWVRHHQSIGFTFCIFARKGILVLDVGILNTMKHHVHSADPKHGLVCIKTGEHSGFEVFHIFSPHQFFLLMLTDISR